MGSAPGRSTLRSAGAKGGWSWQVISGFDPLRRRDRLIAVTYTADALAASALIFELWLFTVYLLIGRCRKYCQLNNQTFAHWWAALAAAVKHSTVLASSTGTVQFSILDFRLPIAIRSPYGGLCSRLPALEAGLYIIRVRAVGALICLLRLKRRFS